MTTTHRTVLASALLILIASTLPFFTSASAILERCNELYPYEGARPDEHVRCMGQGVIDANLPWLRDKVRPKIDKLTQVPAAMGYLNSEYGRMTTDLQRIRNEITDPALAGKSLRQLVASISTHYRPGLFGSQVNAASMMNSMRILRAAYIDFANAYEPRLDELAGEGIDVSQARARLAPLRSDIARIDAAIKNTAAPEFEKIKALRPDQGDKALMAQNNEIRFAVLAILKQGLLDTRAVHANHVKPMRELLKTLENTEPKLTWERVMDYFIQDVCLDAAGNPLINVSPIDNDPRCVKTRDARAGEPVTYWVGFTPRDARGRIMRNVHLPIVFPRLGAPASVRIVDTNLEGGAFGVLDYVDSAWTTFIQSPQTVSISIGSDHGGPKLFLGPQCEGDVSSPKGRFDTAWTIVDRSILTASSNTYAVKPPLGSATTPGRCPAGVTGTEISWRLETLSFGTDDGKGRTPPLQALVYEHTKKDSDHHTERLYFTRELGLVRWEGWDNIAVLGDKDKRRAKAAAMESSGACVDFSGATGDRRLSAPTPSPGGEWVTSGCYETTTILPTTNSQGDSIRAWIERLERSPLYAPLFGTEPLPSPAITALSSSSGKAGDTITISGEHFGSRNIVQFNTRNVSRFVTSTGNSISFTVPQNYDGVPLKAGTYRLSVFNVDNNAHSKHVTFTVTADADPQAAPDSTPEPEFLLE